MSKCSNCGAELPENMKFCTTCGAKVEEQVVAAPAQEQPANSVYSMPAQPVNEVAKEKKPINKKLFIIIGAAVLALIVIIVVAVVVSNIVKNKKAIEAKTIKFEEDFLEVTFEGYDTLGTAKVQINRDEFQKTAYKAMGYSKNSKSDKAAEDFLDLIYGIDLQVDKTNLSNGDIITVKVVADKDVMDDVDVILKDAEFTFEVKDLPEIIKYNPFDDLSVSYSGFDGDVDVSWSYSGYTYNIYSYYFDCDKEYNLSVGDKFTITLDENYVDSFMDQGILLTETKKTYTVESADHYISSIDDISSDMMDDIKENAEAKLEDRYSSYYYDCELDSYELLGMYLFYNDSNSVLYTVYKGLVSSDYEEFDPVEVYMAVSTTSLIERANGNQSCSSYPSFWYNIEYVPDTYYYVYGYFNEKDLFDNIYDDYDEDDYSFDISGDVTDYSDYVEEDEESEESDEDAYFDEESDDME